MNKRELEILKIGFEAGKKAIEMHPDDDEYDTIRFEEAQVQVKNLTIPNVWKRFSEMEEAGKEATSLIAHLKDQYGFNSEEEHAQDKIMAVFGYDGRW